MANHEIYMKRCLQLAALGTGYVAPNPMVGAVLVADNRIIGEGWHKQYGSAHAEVNCLNSVKDADRHLIPRATLYVSLEPCNHFGRTPPCTDLLLQHQIKNVVIGCVDSSPHVNGMGLRKLQDAGVNLLYPIMEDECRALNKRFFGFHKQKRPYIILKWAQTADGFMGTTGIKTKISNSLTDIEVHKWRTQEQAILVGTNTILVDDPELTARHWKGKNPVRLYLDRQGIISDKANIFNDAAPTLQIKTSDYPQTVSDICTFLYEQHITSVLVEGGATLLQSFLQAGVWDEIRVITNNDLFLKTGVPAPAKPNTIPAKSYDILNDSIEIFIK